MNETRESGLWAKTKAITKGGIILALLLIFLIPAHQIRELILEREQQLQEVEKEVKAKWASDQQVNGPVLVIPYLERYPGASNAKKKIYLLPEQLRINGEIVPETKHRGIYEVMLYRGQLKLEGNFAKLPYTDLQINPDSILWNEAYLAIGLSDFRGLMEEIRINWNGQQTNAIASRPDDGLFREAFVAPVSLAMDESPRFSFNMSVKGSGKILFTTIGKTTEVKLASSWKDPSFIGTDLPQHEITDSGMVANWRAMAHSRPFPQAWANTSYATKTAAVGMELFIPVNTYQKTYRTVKYASLLIILTFVAFFVVETITKKSVHPLHYALVGIALLLFYTLLLALSEHILFNASYLIASLATIALIGWFASAILGGRKWGLLMSVVLTLLYSYIFSILQLQDFALLLGSIGLFIALAVVMYLVRKMNW
jgi:inner membrane protein